MSHNIEALIAKESHLREVGKAYENTYVVSLPQGFGLMPITDELDEELRHDESSIEVLAFAIALLTPTALVRTEYFGGGGDQYATVYDKGRRMKMKCRYSGQINKALKEYLGVVADVVSDEFDTLGLGEHRSNEDWEGVATPCLDVITEIRGSISVIQSAETDNPCLSFLAEKGYVCSLSGCGIWKAIKGNKTVMARGPAELLGIVALVEAKGDRWNEPTSNIIQSLVADRSEA